MPTEAPPEAACARHHGQPDQRLLGVAAPLRRGEARRRRSSSSKRAPQDRDHCQACRRARALSPPRHAHAGEPRRLCRGRPRPLPSHLARAIAAQQPPGFPARFRADDHRRLQLAGLGGALRRDRDGRISLPACASDLDLRISASASGEGAGLLPPRWRASRPSRQARWCAPIRSTNFRGSSMLGGAHGHLLATILRRYRKLEGVLYDLPEVVASAAESGFVTAPEVRDRCRDGGRRFFRRRARGLGRLHHEARPPRLGRRALVRISKNCREAMASEGRVLVVDHVVQPGNGATPSSSWTST